MSGKDDEGGGFEGFESMPSDSQIDPDMLDSIPPPPGPAKLSMEIEIKVRTFKTDREREGLSAGQSAMFETWANLMEKYIDTMGGPRGVTRERVRPAGPTVVPFVPREVDSGIDDPPASINDRLVRSIKYALDREVDRSAPGAAKRVIVSILPTDPADWAGLNVADVGAKLGPEDSLFLLEGVRELIEDITRPAGGST